MAKDGPQTEITDLVRQTQALFKLNGAAAPRLEQVMKAQEGILEQAGTFTQHWIERRQDAVEKAIEALNEMNSTDKPDPMGAMQAIANWQRGSFERLTADMQEWMTLYMQAAQLAATPQSEAGQDDAASAGSDRGKAANKSGGRAASSRSKSDHATPV